MRAFMLRRLELIAHEFGDVVVLGSTHCAGTLRVKEFLTRNGHPFHYIDLDRDAEAQAVLDQFKVSAADVPVAGLRRRRGPAKSHQRADRRLSRVQRRDRSDSRERPGDRRRRARGTGGCRLRCVGRSRRPGAGIGFARRASGIELPDRELPRLSDRHFRPGPDRPCLRAGAEVRRAGPDRESRGAARMRPPAVRSGAGRGIERPRARRDHRHRRRVPRPPLANLSQFEGAGVYYTAMPMEAQLCVGEDIIVVGGGNSAGQAAVFLAQTAKRVFVLVRGDGLAETMSRYLIRRIEDNPAIVLRPRTQIVGLEGNGHLERVRWQDDRTGKAETNDIRHVFMMTGAVPNTGWLERCIALDEKGFIKTGPHLSSEDLTAARWPLTRPPYLLESSRPGVFAVGDVRGGNIKRVASAVGEGSIAVAFVHQVRQQ